MHFRPYPILTALALAGLAVLVWLGSWQWSRMGEKAAEIAAYEALTAREPIDLTEVLCPDPAPPGTPVRVPSAVDGTPVRVWGRSGDAAGWRLFRPIALPACAGEGAILAETGFEAFHGEAGGAVERWRIEPVPQAGAFTPANDATADEFYSYDARSMAVIAGVQSLHPDLWIVADRGLPVELAGVPPSRHLGYALTWFGLALTLIGVYLAFHAARGRLGFTRR